MDKQFFIIDFDSTIIQTEGLDELAKIVLKDNPLKESRLEEITRITNLGMEGVISISESLKKRLSLLKINKDQIKFLSKNLTKKISPSILRNKRFFKKYKDQIYVITAGFKEWVIPVTNILGVEESHILANSFKFNQKGQVVGLDQKNPLSKNEGKIKAIKELNLNGEIIIIGDGYTDLQIKQLGVAKHFYAFTENIERKIVIKNADSVISSFDEFLFVNKLPMAISYPKSKMKALLLENIDISAKNVLEKEGYQVEAISSALSEEELIKRIDDVSILGIRSKTKLTQRVIEKANKLKVVGAFCIGTDQMDLKALTEKGVAVFNAPYQNTRSVVELALGEIIILLRRVVEKNEQLQEGIWNKSAQFSNEARGKTLGIIGFGNIGSQLSILAENIGMNVVFYDLIERLPLGNAKAVSLTKLLQTADIISIHVSGDKSNNNLIGEKEFKLMKEGVIFINLSRGFVVDIKALAKYIRLGKIKGAAIDVFPTEPKNKDEKFKSPLQNLPNVILTPHIAGSTQEAQKQIAEFVSDKIINFVNTGNTFMSVNFPNIQLPEQKYSHRLLHLHKNVPGVLAQIYKILVEHGININGQYLKTNDEVGYVIIDVNKKYNEEVLQKLRQIPQTRRFRVLY